MGFKLLLKIAAMAVGSAAGVAQAAWNLDPAKSSMNFVSTKMGNVGEVHRFTEIAGTLSETGEFMLDIDLTSVDTGIEIRDQRMQDDFFEVMKFPLAMAKGRVDETLLENLTQGELTQFPVELSITLHGATAQMSSTMNAVKLSPQTLWVTSDTPVIINTADFNLQPGLEQLRKLAELDSISHAVPVTVNLYFDYTESPSVAAE